MRYYGQLGKLNCVGVDIVTSLPDVAGWQALNLAGPTEDRIERVVSRLPDDTYRTRFLWNIIVSLLPCT